MNTAVIGVGSNIDAERNIAQAVAEIAKAHRLIAQSELVRTTPIGPIKQADFLNGAILIETDLSADDLRAWLKLLEDRLVRRRGSVRFGPRTIDLDIVVWNGQVVDSEVHQREFLRAAVRQLLPELQLLPPAP
jgi:2-amino-4-hydroxy-6-hydroxymethyldihydropteridine diphosphokinase